MTTTKVAALAEALTKAQRHDLLTAIETNGVWWVPCRSTGLPFIRGNGDLTADGLAVRNHLLASGGA